MRVEGQPDEQTDRHTDRQVGRQTETVEREAKTKQTIEIPDQNRTTFSLTSRNSWLVPIHKLILIEVSVL